MSNICDHTNPVTVKQVLTEWLKKTIDIPADSAFTDSIEFTCNTCGATAKAWLRYDILKPGKSRKTHRLWALLKGVA